MKLGSLFDGSGCFPLVAAMEGIEPVWASEIEPFPILVTHTRFPHMKHLGDVTKINGAEIEPVDIISFGSPCQDLSVGGAQKGLIEGERSSLFFEAIRIIREMREATNGKYPRAFIFENVPGAFSSNKGRDWHEVLKAFVGLLDPTADVPRPAEKNGKYVWGHNGYIVGDGYSCGWRVVDAQFWGVAQRRRRIFAVGCFNSERADRILFEREGLRRSFASIKRAWQGVTADTGRSVDGANQVVSEAPQLYENHGQDSRITGPLDTAPTVNSKYGTGGNNTPLVVFGKTSHAKTKDDAQGWEEKTVTHTLNAHDTTEAFASDIVCEYVDTSHMDDVVRIDKVAAPLRARNFKGGANVMIEAFANDPIICIEGNGSRPSHQGNGYSTDGVMYTLNAVEQHKVCVPTDNPVVYGICSKDSNAMKSSNPDSGIYEAKTSRTLDANGGNPSCNQGGMMIVEKHTTDGADQEISPVCIGFKGKAAPKAGITCAEQLCPTLLSSPGVPTVCIGIDRAAYNQGKNAQYKPQFDDNLAANLVAKGPGAVCYAIDNGQADQTGLHDKCGALNCMHDQQAVLQTNLFDWLRDECGIVVKYIVRRLMPIECSRLQGFPDWFCNGLAVEDPTEDDMNFWREVFKTYAAATGVKPKSDNQIRKWLKNPYSDSAEYKMWGNGIALPCALYFMQGIKDELDKQGRNEEQ